VFQSVFRNVRDSVVHEAALCVNENKRWQVEKAVNDIKLIKSDE